MGYMSFDPKAPRWIASDDLNDLKPTVSVIYDPDIQMYRPATPSDMGGTLTIGSLTGVEFNSNVEISGVNIVSGALSNYVINFPSEYKIKNGATVAVTGSPIVYATGDFKITNYATETTLANVTGKISGFNYQQGGLAVYMVNSSAANSYVSGDVRVTGINGVNTTNNSLNSYITNVISVVQSGGHLTSLTGTNTITGTVNIGNQLTNFATESTLFGISGVERGILNQLISGVTKVSISGQPIHTTGTVNATVTNPVYLVGITGQPLFTTGNYLITGYTLDATSRIIAGVLGSGLRITGTTLAVAVTGGNIIVSNPLTVTVSGQTPVIISGQIGTALAVTGDFKITGYGLESTNKDILNQLKSGINITGQPLSVNVLSTPNTLAQISGVGITQSGINVYVLNPDSTISGEFILDPGGQVAITGAVVVSGQNYTSGALRVWVDNQIAVASGSIFVPSGDIHINNPIVAVTGNIVIASGFLNIDEVGISGGYVGITGNVDPSAWLYSRTGFVQNLVAKNSAGTLGGAFVYNNANYNQWIQVFDGNSLNGTPVLIGEALAKNNFSFDIPVRGISMLNGITIANSTGTNGAIVNVSGTTDCFFTVLYK